MAANERNPVKSPSSIKSLLQEQNERVFKPLGYKIELLKDCNGLVPTLAKWTYEDWKLYDNSLTVEKLVAGFSHRLNDDKIPLSLVAFKGDKPIGTVSLKEEKDPAFEDILKGALWLGSLHVIPEERNKGIGGELLRVAILMAEQLDYKAVWLFTSNPLNVEWYQKRGAHLIEKRPFRNHVITLMKIPLKDSMDSR